MALYEYHCPDCGTVTERRMPMSDVLQFIPCPNCGKTAKKRIGNFAVVGRAEESMGEGPAPWEDGGEGFGEDDDLGAHSHDLDHGHSHGPGGHTH